MKNSSKGISPIVSMTLMVAFIIMAIVGTLYWAFPMIDKTERMNEFEGAKLTLERLNDYVRVTAHSGTNSSRFITIDFDKGKLTLTNSSIRYDIVIGEQVIQQGATIYENGIYITGTPFGMRAYVNYTSILLQGDQVMTGKKTLRISKVGDTATQAIVEVREY